MNANTQDLAARLIRQEPSAYFELAKLAETDIEFCAAISSDLLQSEVMYKRLGECIFLLELLNKCWGEATLENWISVNWPDMKRDMREKICYGAYSPAALSTDFVMSLFRSSLSSPKDQHLMLAGLAASAEKRNCTPLVLQLATEMESSIGVASDPTLKAFLRSVFESFPSPR